MDKIDLASLKLVPKRVKRMEADYWSSDEEKSKKAGKKIARDSAIGFGGGSAIVGGAVGGLLGGKKGALTGATAAGLIGAGNAYVSSKAGQSISRKLRKSSEGYRKSCEKASDKYKVSLGEMTKDEFRKKYGK